MTPALTHTRTWVRDVVRSGLLSESALYDEVATVLSVDHPSLPVPTAGEWIAEERALWTADAAQWPEVTDHDRFQHACVELESRGIVVLQGCADHWAAKSRLDQGGCRGIAWFTVADVWHAIDEPMLEVNLWHASTANAAPGDALLDEALKVFTSSGVAAHFDEGRIEVTARWQVRPV